MTVSLLPVFWIIKTYDSAQLKITENLIDCQKTSIQLYSVLWKEQEH